MIAIKKIVLLSFLTLSITTISFSQGNADIGITISSNDVSRIGVEFRHNISSKYKLKYGFIYGENNSPYFGNSGQKEIITSSDSMIIFRNNNFFQDKAR